MDDYVSSAIETIYGGEDDYIVLGLTGRTGSGCSTVAKILQMQGESLTHSLYHGENPSSNTERKQRIIFRHFVKTWEPFKLIQVRSVITLAFLDLGLQPALDFLNSKLGSESGLLTAASSIVTELFVERQEIDALITLQTESAPSGDEAKNNAEAVLNFYNTYLPKKSDELKKSLGEKFIVPLYQEIGKNIRVSGFPFDSTLSKGKSFTLVQKIHSIIRSIIEANKVIGKKSLIVVDALRNPLEAIYLQDRITNFHLVAVSCSNEQRLARLAAQNFSISEIRAIDDVEYSNRDLEIESTYSIQDIQGCLQRADIYLSNPDGPSEVGKFINLTNQLIRTTSLIKRPGIVTPTALERCMQIAYTAKLNSGCISRQVGALVTDQNFSVKAIGWNDTPRGQVPCNLRTRTDLIKGLDTAAFSNFEKNDRRYLDNFTNRSAKYIKIESSGRSISYCFKSEFNSLDGKSNQVHTRLTAR